MLLFFFLVVLMMDDDIDFSPICNLSICIYIYIYHLLSKCISFVWFTVYTETFMIISFGISFIYIQWSNRTKNMLMGKNID